MSSKSAKRRAEFKQREEKRQIEKDRYEAIQKAKKIADLAKAMSLKLR